jgi:hypothetical protein
MNKRQKQIREDIANAPDWPITEPLMPTHSCFDDAVAFAAEVINPELLREIEHRCSIVHGILRLPSGELAAHAWFEADASALFETVVVAPGDPPNPRVVFQGGLTTYRGDTRRVFYAVTAEPFYRYVTQSTRYTLRLAGKLMVMHSSSGPWRREYRELARHGDAAAGGIRGQLEMQTLLCVIDPVAMSARFPA